MPWVKVGDTFHMDPRLLRTIEAAGTAADSRLLNEMAGFIARLATYSAAQKADGYLELGAIQLLGGSIERSHELLALAEIAGLIEHHPDEASPERRKLLADPEFVHIRTQEELAREAERRGDTRDPDIKARVILRDGDICRWCGVPVIHPVSKKSARKAHLDHLTGEGRPDHIVMACSACNSGRKSNPAWSHGRTLRPAPAPTDRYLSDWSRKYLQDKGFMTPAGNVSPDHIAPPIPTTITTWLAGGGEGVPAEHHDRVLADTPTTTDAEPTTALAGGGEGVPAEHHDRVLADVPAAAVAESGRDGQGVGVRATPRTPLRVTGRGVPGRGGQGREGPGRGLDGAGTGLDGHGRAGRPPASQVATEQGRRGRRKRGRGGKER